MDEQEFKHKKVIAYRRLLLVLILGIFIYYIPTIFQIYNHNRSKGMVTEYNNHLKEKNVKLDSLRAYNNWVYQYQNNTVNTTKPDISQYVKDEEMIGYIDIPAIKLDRMPIHQGSTDKVLANGVGTLDFTSIAVGGKNTMAGITGHSGLANLIIFDNIRHLKNGDNIFLDILGTKTAYKVFARKVIDPDSKHADRNFFVRKGKDEIALMTCTPLFINSHRLIVYAKRVHPYKKAKTEKVQSRDALSLVNIWKIVSALIIFIILIIFLITLIIAERKYRKDVK